MTPAILLYCFALFATAFLPLVLRCKRFRVYYFALFFGRFIHSVRVSVQSPLYKFPQKNLRNSSVLRRFCHPKLSMDRAIFFFYCDPLHFVAILLHSTFRVHRGVCSGGQAGGSAPMLTMHRGARIPRRPPSFAVSVKKCPAEVGNGNYRRTDRSTYARVD